MGDLTSDAAPLGNMPSRYPRVPRQPAGTRHEVPEVINITNSTGVHIGPVFHHPAARPAPSSPDPADLPLKRDVIALLQCTRVVGEREKFLVSEHLGETWTSLGRLMRFSAGQLENLKADFPRSQDRTHELLSMWHDREAERATMSAITTLLLDAKAYAVVKRLRD